MPEILGQKFCFRIAFKMTQNIYTFPSAKMHRNLKKRRKNKIKRFVGLMFKKMCRSEEKEER